MAFMLAVLYLVILIFMPPPPICAWVKITHLRQSNFKDTIQLAYE